MATASASSWRGIRFIERYDSGHRIVIKVRPVAARATREIN
jgi:hypothetical protein